MLNVGSNSVQLIPHCSTSLLCVQRVVGVIIRENAALISPRGPRTPEGSH